MRARVAKLLMLFPGALGDFVCLLPTLATLRRMFDGRVTVAAKPSLLELLADDIDRFSIDRREVADLFASTAPLDATRRLLSDFTHVQSWTGFTQPGFADRLRAVAGAQVAVHPFRAMAPGEHAVRYFARCAGVHPGAAPLFLAPAARAWAHELLPDEEHSTTLVVHAGSGSADKNWSGFTALATRWREHARVIWIVGPADDVPARAAGAEIVRDEPLGRIAALLQRAPLFVGNDSGISHLAGLTRARGLALFADTDPLIWRPLGLDILRAAPPAPACRHRCFCTERLAVDLTYATLRALRVATKISR